MFNLSTYSNPKYENIETGMKNPVINRRWIFEGNINKNITIKNQTNTIFINKLFFFFIEFLKPIIETSNAGENEIINSSILGDGVLFCEFQIESIGKV